MSRSFFAALFFFIFAISITNAACSLGVGASCPVSGSPCCLPGLSCSIQQGQSFGICCANLESPCSQNSHCCSGLCENGRCVSAYSCGQACLDSSQCSQSCPFCIPDSSGSLRCSSCIPDTSTQACSSGSECCSGKCNNGNLCVPCLQEGDACQEDSDCCSGFLCAGQIGQRTCIPQWFSSFTGSPCSDQLSCYSSPPSLKELYCDMHNPNPAYFADFPGVCRWCIPQTFKCDRDSPLICCSGGNYVYECRISPAGGSDYFCLPRDGASQNNLPTNWVFAGENIFSHGGRPRTGDGNLHLRESGGGVASFAYNSELILKNSSTYLLEFWTINKDGNPRYSIYDTNNNAYLKQDGTWVFSPLDLDERWEQPELIEPNIGNYDEYVKYSRKFRTLSSNVSHVQLRLYPPQSGEAYIDDLELTEIYDFTIILWFKPNGRQNDRASILWNGAPESEIGMDWYMMSDGAFTISASGTDAEGNLKYLSANSYIYDSNWHQAALVVERIGSTGNGYFRAYLDAVLIGEGEFNVDRLNSSAQFWLGRNGAGGNAFKGRIDELRFYRRALSSQEIAETFSNLYQKRLKASIISSYQAASNELSDIASYYNANLYVRKTLPGTVLSLTFDEPPIEGKIADHSPMLSHAINSNASWSANGKSGGAVYFDGNGAQVNLSNSSLAFGSSDFSISAWIYPESFSTDSCGPSAIYAMGQDFPGTGIYIHNGRLAFSIGTGDFAFGRNYDEYFYKWTHVVAVRKGGSISIYHDGVLQDSLQNNEIAQYVVLPATTRIGGAICSKDTFHGYIDEFRAFSRALSEEEIQQLYYDSHLIYNSKLPSR